MENRPEQLKILPKKHRKKCSRSLRQLKLHCGGGWKKCSKICFSLVFPLQFIFVLQVFQCNLMFRSLKSENGTFFTSSLTSSQLNCKRREIGASTMTVTVREWQKSREKISLVVLLILPALRKDSEWKCWIFHLWKKFEFKISSICRETFSLIWIISHNDMLLLIYHSEQLNFFFLLQFFIF